MHGKQLLLVLGSKLQTPTLRRQVGLAVTRVCHALE